MSKHPKGGGVPSHFLRGYTPFSLFLWWVHTKFIILGGGGVIDNFMIFFSLGGGAKQLIQPKGWGSEQKSSCFWEGKSDFRPFLGGGSTPLLHFYLHNQTNAS